MQKSLIKLIIFDFDGVIITGSNDGYFNCYHKALESVDVLLPYAKERESILKFWGKGHKHQLEDLLKEYPQKVDAAIKTYEACYSLEFAKNIRLVQGADVALRDLSKTYSLAIASGMIKETLNYFLKKFNIDNLFKEIITSDEIINIEDRKPSPYMLNKLIKDFGFEKDEAVYIGDAENDVAMAKKAGIIPVVVSTGHLDREEADKLNVKNIIPDITNLSKELNAMSL
jgi:phosphoglycolate phosphatase